MENTSLYDSRETLCVTIVSMMGGITAEPTVATVSSPCLALSQACESMTGAMTAEFTAVYSSHLVLSHSENHADKKANPGT